MAIINRAKGLSGLNPLSYMGVEGAEAGNTVVPLVAYPDDPVQNDWQNFNLGTLWLNTTNFNLWYLASLSGNLAVWVLLSNGAGPILAINNDVGGVLPTRGLINLFATPNAGHTVAFKGVGNTINLYTTDAFGNTAVGAGSGASITTNVSNTFFGTSAGTLSTGNSNTLVGWGSGQNITTGSENTGVGQGSLSGLVSGLMTGSANTALGYQAGNAYLGAESSNILIGPSTGVLGESNTIHIGTNGTGPGQQNVTYLHGGAVIATNGSVSAGADTGGVASTTTISNANSTTISTGVGSIKMSTANAATNSAWIKAYIGTTPYWIPAFTTNAP
jgi:hypothetical protein